MNNTKKYKIGLSLILMTFFFKGVFLAGIFPIFKGQDESRHYNTVQYLATGKDRDCQNQRVLNKKGNSVYRYDGQVKRDLATYRYSDEVRSTASITQVKKIRGAYYNKTVFVDNNHNGLGEQNFKKEQLSKIQHICPPDIASSSFGPGRISLYQHGLSKIEKALETKNIFVRYYALRIISVLLGVGVLSLAFHIFRTAEFSKRQSLLLVAIISFQPKLVTYFTNINYDVLLIPLWTAFILAGVIILKRGWSLSRLVMLLLALAGAIMTKPSALPLLGLVVFLMARTCYLKFKKGRVEKKILGIVVGTGLIAGIVSFKLLEKVGITAIFSSQFLNVLGEYLAKSLPKIYGSSRDYWGAIGWAADNLTLSYVQVVWLIEWVAWAGLMLWIVSTWGKIAKINPLQFCKNCKGQMLTKCFSGLKRQKIYFWFVLISVIVLQIGIRVADWKIFTGSGNLALGTPGRYWLPNIVPHFVLLGLGLKAITGIGRSKKLGKKYFELGLAILLVVMILYWVYEVVNIIIPRFYL